MDLDYIKAKVSPVWLLSFAQAKIFLLADFYHLSRFYSTESLVFQKAEDRTVTENMHIPYKLVGEIQSLS